MKGKTKVLRDKLVWWPLCPS